MILTTRESPKYLVLFLFDSVFSITALFTFGISSMKTTKETLKLHSFITDHLLCVWDRGYSGDQDQYT